MEILSELDMFENCHTFKQPNVLKSPRNAKLGNAMRLKAINFVAIKNYGSKGQRKHTPQL